MSLDIRPTRTPREDEELALDRPGAQRWRQLDRADAPAVQTPPSRPAGVLDGASRVLGLLIRLTLLLILLAVLWAVISLVGIGARAPASLGEQVGTALERGAGVAASIGQRIADSLDPAHPPRAALAHDVEIDELLRLDVGAELPGTAERTATVASIQRRADADSPDTAVYAVIHSELRVPEETTVLGITVRSTRSPRDDYLYKGESLRIGRRLYKVNWVSIERQQVALVAYRDQDHVTAKLRAEID